MSSLFSLITSATAGKSLANHNVYALPYFLAGKQQLTMFSIKYVLPNEGIQRLNGKVSTFYAHKKFDQLNIAVYVKFFESALCVHTIHFFVLKSKKSQWTMSTDLFYTQVTLSLWLLNHVSFEHNDTIEPDVMLLLGGIEDMKNSPKHWRKVQNIKIFAILMHCKSFPSQLDVV